MFDSNLSNRTNNTNNTKRDELYFDYEERSLLVWEEHCVECSPPYCYGNCPLFLPRADKKCVRLVNGLSRTKEHIGALNCGIDCEFRKWAKIETRFYNKSISDSRERFYNIADFYMGKTALFIAKLLKIVSPTLKPYGAYNLLRRYFHSYAGKTRKKGPDLFYLQCYLKNKESAQLLIQIEATDRIILSEIHQLKRGCNRVSIEINGKLDNITSGKLFVTPLEETNTLIVFSWIDLFYGVTKKKEVIVAPAPKVKVVAWDLDNTLWEGTLVESDTVKLCSNALSVIKELDSRGILNTIVSKNDYNEAMNKLKEFGINDYFLCPAINWGQKSQNLTDIAQVLNLGIDSFAFIDDNIRERAEVETTLPMVRVYADTQIDEILDRPEFDVPITDVSKSRRLSYMQEVSRKEFQASFSDDYDSYLRNLEMELLTESINDSNKERCYELIMRSNQLNLSTHRYTAEEYSSLLSDENTICKAFRCKDKFGDYGIVSFISIKLEGEKAEIIDFVISCRVAKKKVEQAIIISLKDILAKRGVIQLSANLIKTKKNGPLASVFQELPFRCEMETENNIIYVLDDVSTIKDPGIITIKE